MKQTFRMIALLITFCLVFSMTALAGDASMSMIVPGEGGEGESAGDPGAGGPGGPGGEGESAGDPGAGGPGGGGDSAGAAATTIFSISEEGLTIDEAAGTYELTGEVGETSAEGIDLYIGSFTTNGFKVTGGEYTIKDSTIVADVTEEADANDAGGYCAGVSGGMLTIINSNLTTNGKGGRAGNYTVAAESEGTLVVINSNIIQTGLAGDPNGYTAAIADPPSNAALGISGYARANMSYGRSHTYYYGSYVETEGWAALSTDSANNRFTFYAYDTTGKGLHGGYGTYADTTIVDWFYASVLSGAEIGAILSNNGEIHMYNGADATEEALLYLPEDYEVTEGYVERNGGNLVEAGRNDFQLHSPDMMGSGAGSDYHALVDLKDTAIITSEELDAQATLVDWYQDYGPAMGEYVDFIKGANFLVKSTGSYITLDNVTAESYSDTLLLTVLNSDSMSRYAHADNDMTGKGSELTIKNSDITGDVDHYDYQRNCIVTLDNATWTGAYRTLDKEGWDALWSEECKADASCYWILDPAVYFDGTGTTASLIVGAGSVWNVTDESVIDSLTVEAGGVINGTVTVNGEAVDTAAGGTWEGEIVVTPGEGAPEGESPEGESAEGESAAEAPAEGAPAGDSGEAPAEGESAGGPMMPDGSMPPDPPADLAPGEEPPGGFGGIDG